MHALNSPGCCIPVKLFPFSKVYGNYGKSVIFLLINPTSAVIRVLFLQVKNSQILPERKYQRYDKYILPPQWKHGGN